MMEVVVVEEGFLKWEVILNMVGNAQEELSNFGASLHIIQITDFIVLNGYLQG